MAEDWEDDDWESTPAPAPTAANASAPDDWEDEDVEPAVAPALAAAAPKPSAPMKQSKRIALALKEKERAEQAATVERALKREAEMSAMDEASRKMAIQKIVEESDLENTRDLFMGGGESKSRMLPGEDGETLHTMNPTTPEELAKYASMLTEKCRKFNKDKRRTARYMVFVKEVVRGLCVDLDAEDAKELAMHMSTISNVKLEESKKARGGGKKKTSKKANVRVGLDRADDIRDDYANDGLDDFL